MILVVVTKTKTKMTKTLKITFHSSGTTSASAGIDFTGSNQLLHRFSNTRLDKLVMAIADNHEEDDNIDHLERRVNFPPPQKGVIWSESCQACVYCASQARTEAGGEEGQTTLIYLFSLVSISVSVLKKMVSKNIHIITWALKKF